MSKNDNGIHTVTPIELYRASGLPDELAVYKAAERERERKRRRRTREEHCRRAARRRLFVLILVVLAIILCAVIMARAMGMDQQDTADMQSDMTPAPAVSATTPEAMETPDTVGEDPQESEKIEEALLAQGYLSDAVPLSYDLQDIMRTACAEYACPYPLALAVAEVESHFNMDTVGAAGEVGIMQLNPGPSGSYHAELEADTGTDPTTPAGNIVCGVYLLGKYMDKYGDPEKAAMVYNMGEDGATEAVEWP